jgi:hypothetical protein
MRLRVRYVHVCMIGNAPSLTTASIASELTHYASCLVAQSLCAGLNTDHFFVDCKGHSRGHCERLEQWHSMEALFATSAEVWCDFLALHRIDSSNRFCRPHNSRWLPAIFGVA